MITAIRNNRIQSRNNRIQSRVKRFVEGVDRLNAQYKISLLEDKRRELYSEYSIDQYKSRHRFLWESLEREFDDHTSNSVIDQIAELRQSYRIEDYNRKIRALDWTHEYPTYQYQVDSLSREHKVSKELLVKFGHDDTYLDDNSGWRHCL